MGDRCRARSSRSRRRGNARSSTRPTPVSTAFEKKAESAHGKVIRITDQTRSSIQRLIASLEKQAETYGKSGVDRLISQRDQLLQRYAKEPTAIDAITRSYEKMIAVEQKAATEAAMAKAAKEAEEALKKQTDAIKSFGDRVGQFIENPVQGAKGAIGSLLSSMGPFGVGITAGATALAGFGIAAFEAAKSLGEYGTRVKDAELRTGLTAKEVGQFSFAAKAVGQDISVVERLMRGLSQAADENSREGEKARATLQRMGDRSAHRRGRDEAHLRDPGRDFRGSEQTARKGFSGTRPPWSCSSGWASRPSRS